MSTVTWIITLIPASGEELGASPDLNWIKVQGQGDSAHLTEAAAASVSHILRVERERAMSAGGAKATNGLEASKLLNDTPGLVDNGTADINHQQDLNQLPMLEPPVFAGDPLLYLEWSRSFDHLISIPM